MVFLRHLSTHNFLDMSNFIFYYTGHVFLGIRFWHPKIKTRSLLVSCTKEYIMCSLGVSCTKKEYRMTCFPTSLELISFGYCSSLCFSYWLFIESQKCSILIDYRLTTLTKHLQSWKLILLINCFFMSSISYSVTNPIKIDLMQFLKYKVDSFSGWMECVE